jgi:NAD-dependent SIR2 family protein deacetylase
LYEKQNIDTLERVAGLPAEKIVEAHGTFHTSHCLECKHEYTVDWMKGKSTAIPVTGRGDLYDCETRISVRGRVNPKAIVWLEGLGKLKTIQ